MALTEFELQRVETLAWEYLQARRRLPGSGRNLIRDSESSRKAWYCSKFALAGINLMKSWSTTAQRQRMSGKPGHGKFTGCART